MRSLLFPEITRMIEQNIQEAVRAALKMERKASPLDIDNLEPLNLEEMAEQLAANGYEVKKTED